MSVLQVGAKASDPVSSPLEYYGVSLSSKCSVGPCPRQNRAWEKRKLRGERKDGFVEKALGWPSADQRSIPGSATNSLLAPRQVT